jgi:serine/threonine protein phosphatase 1
MRFDQNTEGRDFVVGDIHGCFDALSAAMDSVQFDPATDRMFSVGDLVDRGKQSMDAVNWLAQPWFHAVMGNHEAMAINFAMGHNHAFHYERNGGRWFIDLPDDQQVMFAELFACMPLAIQVETPTGTVGIVHAEVPGNDWERLRHPDKQAKEVALWARDRIEFGDDTVVSGIDRVYVGHTPIDKPTQLGNVHYIDTGAVFGYELTIVQINQDPQK